MQDFIPVSIRGEYFGKRLSIATALGAVLSLAAGMSVDLFKTRFPEIGIYSVLFLTGAGFGFLGVYFLSRIPEPRMTVVASRGILTVLFEPFHDKNFRQLLIFLGAWNLMNNLAAPFFTVYMLKRIGLSMTLVLGLSVLSQIANVLFFQVWGSLADRFSNKSVLAVTGPLFILSILCFPFTTMPDAYILTIPLLVVIHALAGMSSAGVLLCTGNIALKRAPQGKSTSYLAINALISGLAATIAPILGGVTADWFGYRELRLTFTWTSTAVGRVVAVSPMNHQGLDFLFIMAVLVGIYALHRLAYVKEFGEVEKGVVLLEFYGAMRRSLRSISNVAGVRNLFQFPYNRLMDIFADDSLPQENSASPGFLNTDSLKKQLGLNKEKHGHD